MRNFFIAGCVVYFLAGCGSEPPAPTCHSIAMRIAEHRAEAGCVDTGDSTLAGVYEFACTVFGDEPTREAGEACMEALDSFEGCGTDLPSECFW